jgi:hypothetical protein
MDLQELLDLIAIRSYVVNSVANPIFERAIVRDLDGILILLDKKIAGILTGKDFKEYIGFADVRKAIEEVARTTNIKSGLHKK